MADQENSQYEADSISVSLYKKLYRKKYFVHPSY